ncbi:MAG: hypothetical protein Q9221_006793 [Calogaya cf. arnoldii]
MLLHSVLSLFLLSAAAFNPSGGGRCYHIDGSEDTLSSACYILNTVGASMCCLKSEQCHDDGLCYGSPTGLIGPYDDDTSIWRHASFCPRSPDNVNVTCCETRQGTMLGLDQAHIAASLVSSIRAPPSTTISPPSSAAPTLSRTLAYETPRLSPTPGPSPPAPSAASGGGLSQETKATLGTALPALFITAVGIFLGRKWWKNEKEKRKSFVQNAHP